MKNVYLGNNALPDYWYNIASEYPHLYVPPINPLTHKEISSEEMIDLYPETLALQDVNTTETQIKIPTEVLEKYVTWRPTPLVRAKNLENYLGTKCKIYYKNEGVSPIGSHKANSAIAQAFYCKQAGYEELVTETGAGQVGSAVSMASAFYNLICNVFMVKTSYESKPGRKILMQTYGANVHSSPSTLTPFGRSILEKDANFPGSLGTAIAEAIEYARKSPKAAYVMGSAANFVCLHQTIIGNELKRQLDDCSVNPDYIISCIGGGSSFAGIAFPFLKDKLDGKYPINFIAVESKAAPKVSEGIFSYDYGDSAKLTPLNKMYTLGHTFVPKPIHAGGLRYHGLSPLVSNFLKNGYGEIKAYEQYETFQAGQLFARCEGYLPAPESCHSIKAAIDIALENINNEKNIIFCLTGHGCFDLAGYDAFNSHEMKVSSSSEDEIKASLLSLENHLKDLNIK